MARYFINLYSNAVNKVLVTDDIKQLKNDNYNDLIIRDSMVDIGALMVRIKWLSSILVICYTMNHTQSLNTSPLETVEPKYQE